METLLTENDQEKEIKLLNNALLICCSGRYTFYKAYERFFRQKMGDPTYTLIEIPEIDRLQQRSKYLLSMTLNYISLIIDNFNLNLNDLGYFEQFSIECSIFCEKNIISIMFEKTKETNMMLVLIKVNFTDNFINIKTDKNLKEYSSIFKDFYEYKIQHLFLYQPRFFGDINKEQQSYTKTPTIYSEFLKIISKYFYRLIVFFDDRFSH